MHIKEVSATKLGQALDDRTQGFSITFTFGLNQQISFKMEQRAPLDVQNKRALVEESGHSRDY